MLLIVPVFLAVGCGPSDNKSKVSGTITYKGEGLKAGNIYLTSDAGGSYSSPIQPDGSYTITDVPQGNYIAIVETETINPDKKTGGGGAMGGKAVGAPQLGAGSKGEALNKEYANAMKGKGGGGDNNGAGGFGAPPIEELRKRYVKIPAKYGSKITSDIVVEVTSNQVKKDIPLTD